VTARAIDMQLKAQAGDVADCGDGQRVKHAVRLEQCRRASLECSTDSKVRRVNALHCKHARTSQTIGVCAISTRSRSDAVLRLQFSTGPQYRMQFAATTRRYMENPSALSVASAQHSPGALQYEQLSGCAALLRQYVPSRDKRTDGIRH
jgi:hypothetical protein